MFNPLGVESLVKPYDGGSNLALDLLDDIESQLISLVKYINNCMTLLISVTKFPAGGMWELEAQCLAVLFEF